MENETELLEKRIRHQINLRVKLRNSLSELRFLAYMYCEFYGYKTTTSEVIGMLDGISKRSLKLPEALLKIYLWYKLLEASNLDDLEENLRKSFTFTHQKFEELNKFKK